MKHIYFHTICNNNSESKINNTSAFYDASSSSVTFLLPLCVNSNSKKSPKMQFNNIHLKKSIMINGIINKQDM